MINKCLVIGITGVTCGGKTTLTRKLQKQIKHYNKHSKFHINVTVVSQDDYFLDVEDVRHIWVEEINHIHFDIITSLDMDKMYKNILDVVSSEAAGDNYFSTLDNGREIKESNGFKEVNGTEDANTGLQILLANLTKDINVLIIEGFSIFKHSEIYKLCDLKYFFILDYEECKRRRLTRVYDPPDCEGYFDVCVWPEYEKYLKLVQENVKGNCDQIRFFESNTIDRSVQVWNDINEMYNKSANI